MGRIWIIQKATADEFGEFRWVGASRVARHETAITMGDQHNSIAIDGQSRPNCVRGLNVGEDRRTKAVGESPSIGRGPDTGTGDSEAAETDRGLRHRARSTVVCRRHHRSQRGQSDNDAA